MTNKPRCCPDPDCNILFFTRHNPNDVGDSFDCYGKIIEFSFDWKGNEHTNDISHCTYTPLKGMIRYFENADDQTLMIARQFRLLAMLGFRKFNLNWYFSKAISIPEIASFKVDKKIVSLIEHNDSPPNHKENNALPQRPFTSHKRRRPNQ